MNLVVRCCAFALALAFASAAAAADYRPQQQVHGDVRVWGSPEDAGLLALWDAGFHAHQPDAHVVAQLHGPESTMAGLYTGVADVAFVARELRLPVENMAFQWVKLYPVTTIEVANATVGADRLACNLAVFVHPDNPLRGLTLAALDGIFGGERKRGSKGLQTWGDLGLDGAWRERAIHPVSPAVDSIAAITFRRRVMENSFKWSTALHEFPSEAEAIDAVAHDPSAIAFARVAVANDHVRAVPLAAKDGAPFVALDAKSATDRSYPLARAVIVAIDRKPGTAVDPKVREFVRYVLSDEGQAAIARDGAYLPLAASTAQQQRERVE